MKHPYSTLLSPILRRGFVIRNRMAMSRAYPPFSTGVESREPREILIPYVKRLAENGAAIVTLPSVRWENPDSRPMSFPGPPPMEDHRNRFEPEESPPEPGAMAGPDITIANVKLTYIHAIQAVHDQGSLALISLMEMEPSGWEINEIPSEALDRLTDGFARRCRQFQKLGIDGCGFYMCYRSSLMAKALSPDLNRRTDRYGIPGALAMEAFKKVREACGEKFLIEIEVSGQDISDGFTLEDMAGYLKQWESYIDIVQLRAPTVELAHAIGANSNKEEPITLAYAKALKAKGFDLILAPSGGFQDPARNEGFLAEGCADMIFMARAFVCDSEYDQKILEGRGDDITPCIRCNKCHTKPAEPNPGCSVNPRFSLDLLPCCGPKRSVRTLKKVAVVGGGPAGMEAAITASALGHQVTLYEQASQLGGQLIAAGTADFKWPVRDFLLYLRRQIQKSDVHVMCNTRATPELLKSEAYDAVLLAAGAEPLLPNIPGASLAQTAISVYSREIAGQRIVIIGGSETGIETAMYLANQGKDVTVLTRQRQAAHDAHDVHYREIMEKIWTALPNLNIITQAATVEITEHAVYYSRETKITKLCCDAVIALGGMQPRQSQATAFAALTPRFRVIGDCRSVGDIRQAMRDGYTAAITL